uniref:Uncharacterized protein n=1 Tax=Anguilla anguilla TaxID=7936 RepID=A0A0E9QIC3_ANGAN
MVYYILLYIQALYLMIMRARIVILVWFQCLC